MKHLLEEAGIGPDQVEVDSAGTIGMHAGNPPDSRMTKAAANRGIPLVHAARQVTAQDLADFDLILVMDEDNLRDVLHLDPSRQYRDRIKLFCEYCKEHSDREVPDPYYGGAAGFEHVLDLLEDGCATLVSQYGKPEPA